jgi:hypothetical protein
MPAKPPASTSTAGRKQGTLKKPRRRLNVRRGPSAPRIAARMNSGTRRTNLAGGRGGWEEAELEPTRARGRVLCCRKAGRAFGVTGLAPCSRESFLRRPGWEEFRSVLACLRDSCPTAKTVVVRTSWLPENILGECARRRKSFVIRLNNRLDEQAAIETLLHEWAHAMSWSYSLDHLANQPDVDPREFEHASHDEAWGCAYSRVWRAYQDRLCHPEPAATN